LRPARRSGKNYSFETHQEAKELEREERVAAHIVDASCDHPTDGKSGIWSLTTPTDLNREEGQMTKPVSGVRQLPRPARAGGRQGGEGAI